MVKQIPATVSNPSRQIDGRIRFLTKRIEAAEVVDPEAPRAGQRETRAFFGATVRYVNAAGAERVVTIVGDLLSSSS
jgi:transcription elongation factor GreB